MSDSVDYFYFNGRKYGAGTVVKFKEGNYKGIKYGRYTGNGSLFYELEDPHKTPSIMSERVFIGSHHIEKILTGVPLATTSSNNIDYFWAKLLSGIAIIMLLIFGLYVGATRDPLRPGIKACAISMGLENVTLKANKFISKDKEYVYNVRSSNFDQLSYDEMLTIALALTEYRLPSSYDTARIRHYESNGNTYECNPYIRRITKNGKVVYNDYENSPKRQEELAAAEEEEAKKKEYANSYPFPGMREEYLRYTILGEPDSVELCRDFYKLQTRAQSKTYEWKATDTHGWYKVHVRYRLKVSRRFDDYMDLPSDNGYISEITYTDGSGSIKTKRYVDSY